MARKFSQDILKVQSAAGSFQGLAAMCGESSYDIARRNGFTGTEQEFLQAFAPDALVQGVTKLTQDVSNITPVSGAAAHNGIFKGRKLNSKYTIDQIAAMISNGSFSDLYIGDYFEVTINTTLGGTEVVKCMMAGFDTFWNNGDGALTRHHAVIVPKDCFNKTNVMNDTHVTTGGYFSSKMHQTILPVYAAALQSALNNHILTYRSLLTTSVNNDLDSCAGAGFKGATNGWEWKDVQLRLMNEVNLYGCNVFASSFYDTGCNNLQFPLFALAPDLKVAGLGNGGSRVWYWLSAVASSTYFADCDGNGLSDNTGAAGSGGVRPYFLIG